MYHYYSTSNQVIAVSTYAGKTVRGVAKCDPRDEFNLEKGKELATRRCAVKIAEKRMKRAFKKNDEAAMALAKATSHFEKMYEYEQDAVAAYNKAMLELEQFESEL